MAQLDLIAELRDDHRRVRDGLLELINTLASRDAGRAKRALERLDLLVDPHFRFEEQALYPALRAFVIRYTDQVLDQLDRLVEERKELIEAVRSNADFLVGESIGDEEASRVADTARALLVHVSNCDGLASLIERFGPREFEQLSQRYVASKGGERL